MLPILQRGFQKFTVPAEVDRRVRVAYLQHEAAITSAPGLSEGLARAISQPPCLPPVPYTSPPGHRTALFGSAPPTVFDGDFEELGKDAFKEGEDGKCATKSRCCSRTMSRGANRC